MDSKSGATFMIDKRQPLKWGSALYVEAIVHVATLFLTVRSIRLLVAKGHKQSSAGELRDLTEFGDEP